MTKSELIEMLAGAIHNANPAAHNWDSASETCKAIARSIASAVLDRLGREGLAVVPREPTQAMLNRAMSPERDEEGFWGVNASSIYRAMIAASEKESNQ